jgi:hypothetical protein
MASQHGGISAESRRARRDGRWPPGVARLRRGRRLFGWLAATALLMHGWLPIVLQAALAGGHGGSHVEHHGHLTHEPAAAAPDPGRSGPEPDSIPASTSLNAATPHDLRRSGDNRECPILHDPICLCAIFVSLLMPASGLVPAPGVVHSALRRRPRSPPRRCRRVMLFEARAPPRLP